MQKRLYGRHGFTLIELVVVTALIVLIVATIYPLLQHWTEGAVRQAARRMTASIERLFEQAVTTRQIYRLRLKMPGDRYWPEVRDATGTFVPAGIEQKLPSGVIIRDVMMSVGGEQGVVSFGEAAVYFYPVGRLDPVIIHLEQPDRGVTGTELSLLPHPLTGRVTIAEGYVEFDT